MTEVRPAGVTLSVSNGNRASSSSILKFINQQNSNTRIEGKKCNPQRQFGVSLDAPKEFLTKNSLISDMINFKQAKARHDAKPEFYSQKNFFNVGHGSHSKEKIDKNNFVKQYNQSHSQNKIAFHRNSSKISKFYENNAWMGDRFYVMGHQRSEKALQIAKTNVQINTRTARTLSLSKKRSMTAATSTRTLKFFPTHQSMKELFMSEKSKIREMRNMLASQPQPETQEKRPHTSIGSFNRSSSQKIKFSLLTERKPREFQVNIPEWGQKDFNVRFIDWDPQRSKERQNDMNINFDRKPQTPGSSRRVYES